MPAEASGAGEASNRSPFLEGAGLPGDLNEDSADTTMKIDRSPHSGGTGSFLCALACTGGRCTSKRDTVCVCERERERERERDRETMQ